MPQIAGLSPSPLARVTIYMRSGAFFTFALQVCNILFRHTLAESFFLPRCVIYYFCLLGRKYHFRSRRQIANVVFSASPGKQNRTLAEVKNVFFYNISVYYCSFLYFFVNFCIILYITVNFVYFSDKITEMYKKVQKCTEIYRDVQKSTKIYRDVQRSTKIYRDVHESTKIYNSKNNLKSLKSIINTYILIKNSIYKT